MPLEEKTPLPIAMRQGFPKAKAYFDKLNAEYDEFNALCETQRQQMFETRILNIMQSNSIDGWETVGELEFLKKTFDFSSFEQAAAFVEEVGQFADANDHHPEWKNSNDGLHVEVSLTSHFNNNHLTLADFELAEHMNKVYGRSLDLKIASLADDLRVWGLVAIGGITGLWMWANQGMKSYAAPNYDELVAAPTVALKDVTDFAAYEEQTAIAASQKRFQ